VAALVVEQFAIRIAGASSKETVSKWTTSSHAFGTFLVEHGRLDAPAFQAFYEHLEASCMAVRTKKNYWKSACTLASDLMRRGRVRRFKIPRHYEEAKVRAATPPPPVLSDGLATSTVGVEDGYLLMQIIDWCYGQLDRWDRLRAMSREILKASAGSYRAAEGQVETGFQRISMPQDWIAAFVDAHRDELIGLEVPLERNSLSGLAFCLSYATKNFNGVPLTVTEAKASGDETTLGKVYRTRIGRVGMAAPGLFTAMMVPGYDQAAALAILLSAAMVNPTSILTMEHACLEPSQQPGVTNLVWSKPRAGGEMPGIGLQDLDVMADDDDCADVDIDIKGRRSRALRNLGGRAPTWSIVSAVSRYRSAAEPLRGRAPALGGYSSRLLLAQGAKAGLAAKHAVVTVETMCRSVRFAAARCAADLARSDPCLAGLTFTLSQVRNSAIQDHNRRSGSREKTKSIAQHRNGQTTARYLENPQLKAASTARTRIVQGAMVAAIRDGTLVVAPERAPAGLEQIGHGIGCRDRMAGIAPNERAGRACEAFLCCLTCSKSIVVATPLSFALLLRFRDHLSAPGERQLIEPERHARWVKPAIEVATRAMAEFPPAIAVEGTALAARLDIDFRGIW
jgi:hypothetical protein